MTKEFDFLSLSKASTNKIDTTSNNTKSIKKEGISLFDSFLINNKVDAKNTDLAKDNESVKTSLKNETKEELNIEKDVKVSTKIDSLETKEDITTKQSSSSILDKMIIETKKNPKTIEADSLIKNVDTNDTNIKNQEISTQTPKSETSLFDKLTKDVKIENKINTNEIPKELKDKNSSLVFSKEVEVIKNDLNVGKNNPNELEVDTENKNELKDEKEIKVNATKEQVQTTLNFEETSNDELKIEVKTEIKSSEISKNIQENNSQNKVIKDTSNEVAKNLNISKNTDPKIELKDTSTAVVKNLDPKIELKDTSTAEVKNLDISKNIEENKTVTGEKLSSTNVLKSNNETVSKEFNKLDLEKLSGDEQKINIDKNVLLNNNTSESKNTKSLMDRLLDNAIKTIDSSTNLSQNDINSKVQSTVSKTSDLVTNIFLGSQKNSIYTQMVTNKSEGVKVVKDGKNLEDIKKGAEILNLGLEDSSVETEVEKDPSKINTNKVSENKESILNRLAFDRNTNNENQENKLSNKIAEKLEAKALNTQNIVSSQTTTSTMSSDSSLIEEPVTLNVNPNLALTIQNRIIGAQQHMSSMMSDVARNMYENYKAPITAFRINLFPAQLGQIAILMKNDKENSISISLNMSNSNTLDSFVENQSVLKDALNKNFNNNQTIFNLDFNLDSESSGKQSSDEQNKENYKNNEVPSSDEIIEAINQNQNTGEDLNYL